MNKLIFVVAPVVILTQPCLAVFPLLVGTDNQAIPEFTAGSYIGDGTVQPGVAATSFDADGLQNRKLIDGLSNGTLSLDTSVSGGRVSNTLSVDIGVSVVGGTGDLYVANSANYDGGDDKFNSVGMSGLAGVSSVTFTFAYNEYVAGRDSATSGLNNRPLMSALGLVSTGTGLNINNFNVVMTLSDTAFSSDGVNFTLGPPNVTSYSSAAWDAITNGGTKYDTTDGFAGTVSLGNSDTDFLLLKGFDFDSANNYDSTDSDKFYARTQTWTITPTGGETTFAEDTQFTFSMDGKQYANISSIPVPEPTAFALIGLGSLGVLLRRSRK